VGVFSGPTDDWWNLTGGTDILRTNIATEQVIQDGLVLNLDAGVSSSYPGSGTSWTDLSGNGNNGTLENGVGYNSSNGGSLTFDGGNDYARIPNNGSLDTQTPSVEVWIKTNATAQYGFWFEKGSVNRQYSLFQDGGAILWRQRLADNTLTNLSITTSNFINTSNWYQVVGTFVSGSRRLYINGVQVNSDTLSGTIATHSDGASIGAYGGYFGSKSYYYNGNLAVCRVYNKALSASEIQQNFNATRSRFGI
jgi:hypothetical protein